MPALTKSRYSTSITLKQKAVYQYTPHKQPGLPRYARAHGHRDTTAQFFRTTELEDFTTLKSPATEHHHPPHKEIQDYTLGRYFISLSKVPETGLKIVKLVYFPFVLQLTV